MTLESSKQPEPQPSVSSGAPNEMASRTCATCAHLVGLRHQTQHYEGWVCGAPSNIASHKLNLVSGVLEPQYRFRQCLEARKDVWHALPPNKRVLNSCGEAGQWWELYVQPEYSPKAGGKASSSKTAEELLRELE